MPPAARTTPRTTRARAAAKGTRGNGDDAAALLTPEQRRALAAAKAWWQEGERRLDFLAEKARQETLLAQAVPLLTRLRAPLPRHDPGAIVPDALAPLLRLARQLSPNRTLNRTRESVPFARAVRDLLFDEGNLPGRITAFLRAHPGVGAHTASQLLFLAFPDRFPLVSPATRAVLAPPREQRARARRIARERYDGPPETPPAVAALLADFVLYEAARDALGAESFLDVNAVLWHARESFPLAEASKATATARRVRETGADYGTKPAADDAEPAEAELLALIEAHVAAQGFTFPPLAVRDYYVALKTKPFVILSGLSGTGKTRLTELMAEALTGNLAAQYRLLPVRPDWTDATPLLGFFNLLAGEYVGAPFLDLLVEADRPENRGLAFFVCLDEMNLARVEHYFADVLSAMETTARTIPLQGSPRGGVRVPPNLFITGSVNVDEATHPFSKKVLDRANTIEFTEVCLRGGDGLGRAPRRAVPEIAPRARQRIFLHSRVADVGAAREKLALVDPSYPDRILAALAGLNDLLQTRGAHFGYRVRDEALMYAANAFDASGRGLFDAGDPDANLAVALDLQIVQKALPRVAGTQEALEPLLGRLIEWAGNESYPRTRAKLEKMRARAAEEGVVTFYEP